MEIEVNGVRTNYELTGKGKPLVLLHGMGRDLTMWEAQVPVFAKQYQVLAYDLRGFGRSAKPPGPYSTTVWAKDLVALLQALNLGPAALIGFSLGGRVLQRLALDHPQVVAALVLSSTGSTVTPESQAQREETIRTIQAEGLAAVAQANAERGFSPGYRQRHPEAVEQAKEIFLRNDPQALVAAMRTLGEFDFTPELGRIRCPTLIIHGSADTGIPPETARLMQSKIPGAQLRVAEGSAHNVPNEQPEQYNAWVLEFLAKAHK